MSKSASQTQAGIHLGKYVFSPGILPTLATLLILCLLVNLGFWQLRRAEAKAAIVERHESRNKQAARALQDLTEHDFKQDLTDFPLTVTGHYLNQYNLLLDNRPHLGQPGYQLLTAFLTGGKILLVNRGWIAQGPDRSVFPTLPAEQGEQQLTGLIHTPNPNFFVLKEDDYSKISWPLLIQKIDLEKSRQLFDHPVIPFVLRLAPDDSSGFIREWHSHFMGPEKHYGYAVQWFALSLALIVIYIVVNTHRKQQQSS
jgi:surfeit locus 1 family protein